MKLKRLLSSFGVTLSLFGCSGGAPAPAEQPKPPAEIPITSKSPEAIDHFKKGRDLADNLRLADAAKELDQAVKLDPDFALALAYRGVVNFGPEGLKDFEQANAKAASASKAEQLMIGALLSASRRELAKSEDLWKQLTEAVPDDWRAHMGRGTQLYVVEKYGEAIDAMNKAIARNPDAGPAYNMVGYAHLVRGEASPAVDAFKKYASLAPTEPNPQDSLGEALMANGQFADAEAAFQKAVSLSPAFGIAWEGIAYTKFFRGDWAGGQAAVAKAREAATRSLERVSAARLGAFGTLAEGKTADGLRQLDALAKSPDASPIDIAFAPADRATVLVEGARYGDALADAAKTIKAADSGQLPQVVTVNLRDLALEVTAAAQGRMGDAAGVGKTVAALQTEAAARPDDPSLKSTVHFAQGMLAAAQKDMKGAQMHFEMCSQRDVYCQWQAVEVSRKIGDKEGADASLARLTKVYVRNPVYLYARSTAAKQTN